MHMDNIIVLHNRYNLMWSKGNRFGQTTSLNTEGLKWCIKNRLCNIQWCTTCYKNLNECTYVGSQLKIQACYNAIRIRTQPKMNLSNYAQWKILIH